VHRAHGSDKLASLKACGCKPKFTLVGSCKLGRPPWLSLASLAEPLWLDQASMLDPPWLCLKSLPDTCSLGLTTSRAYD